MEIERLLDAGDRVVSLFRLRAVGAGSGAAVERRDGIMWTFRDDKLFRVDYFNDQDEALEAVGLRDQSLTHPTRSGREPHLAAGVRLQRTSASSAPAPARRSPFAESNVVTVDVDHHGCPGGPLHEGQAPSAVPSRDAPRRPSPSGPGGA
jgi:hypothetical protein